MTGFSAQIKDWRSRRGVSQLSLSLDAGVSTRHISFLETGRARPSRDMVMRLAQALDLPLRERNGLLLSAGFAPRFGQRSLNDDDMRQALRAVRLMLDAHEPYPAFALDRYWDIVLWNRPLEALLADLTRGGRSVEEINAFFAKLGGDDKKLIIYEGGYHQPHSDLQKEQVFSDIEKWIDGRSSEVTQQSP